MRKLISFLMFLSVMETKAQDLPTPENTDVYVLTVSPFDSLYEEFKMAYETLDRIAASADRMFTAIDSNFIVVTNGQSNQYFLTLGKEYREKNIPAFQLVQMSSVYRFASSYQLIVYFDKTINKGKEPVQNQILALIIKAAKIAKKKNNKMFQTKIKIPNERRGFFLWLKGGALLSLSLLRQGFPGFFLIRVRMLVHSDISRVYARSIRDKSVCRS